MKHGSLFSGIGGFDLAAQWMGWENVFHCEINEFGRKVLNYYWPKSISYYDIKTTDFSVHRGGIDILTGGFPCQPYSQAGKRLGKEDERHLWPYMLRAIQQIQPSYVVGENVRGLTNWNGGMVFDEVQSDLEAEGYEVLPFLLPACAVNAPHRRDRIWFIAYSSCKSRQSETRQGREKHIQGREALRDNNNSNGGKRDVTNSNSRRQSSKEYGKEKTGRITKTSISGNWENFPTQSPICSGNDGLPTQLDGITFPKWRNESIKGYGNAIVPQVVYQIFKSIEQYSKGLLTNNKAE